MNRRRTQTTADEIARGLPKNHVAATDPSPGFRPDDGVGELARDTAIHLMLLPAAHFTCTADSEVFTAAVARSPCRPSLNRYKHAARFFSAPTSFFTCVGAALASYAPPPVRPPAPKVKERSPHP